MSNVWFTSDLHIGHEAIAQRRAEEAMITRVWRDGQPCPKHDVRWHDEALAIWWDDMVGPADHVWVLGDLSGGGIEATARALNWVRDRPGTKHLVPGNHDPIHPMYRDAHRWHGAFRQVFASVQPYARRRVPFTGHQSVLLSHFPYEGDSGPTDRHVQYRLRDYGLPIIHGHIHRPWRATASTPIYRVDPGSSVRPNQFHVGVDAWELKPVHSDQLAELMREVGTP